MLPKSTKSVFTHGDLVPRNIMVAKNGQGGEWMITGLIDWEGAGWYPHHWEYANLVRCVPQCVDYQKWILRTVPKDFDGKVDITGIKMLRRALFM